MITLYSGTPGSGKSFHTIKKIIFWLSHGKNVIANFPVNVDMIKCKDRSKLGVFIFKDNTNLSVEYLYQFAKKNHVKGKEGQTKVVMDEAQSKFNPRDFRQTDRQLFNQFFSVHRHLGYDVLLISQNDRLIDRQIRCNLEYEIKHRKVNNFGTIGAFMPFKVFACIERWYGVNEKLGSQLIIFNKKLASMYDSYTLFERLDDIEEDKKVFVEDVREIKGVKVKTNKSRFIKTKYLRILVKFKYKYKRKKVQRNG